MSSLPPPPPRTSLPAKLSPPLSDRDAINDAIYRAVLAFDANSADLLDSSLTEDGVLEVDGRVMRGRAAVRAQCFDLVARLDTTHFVTNTRVDIDAGGATASATVTALAQHCRAGQGADPAAPRFLAGATYWLDLVKDEGDGLWRARYWKLRSVWGEGDRGVLSGV